MLYLPYLLGLWLSGRQSVCQGRRCRFHPWVGISPVEGNGNAVQYSCLKDPMDRGAWRATGSQEMDTTERLNRQHQPMFVILKHRSSLLEEVGLLGEPTVISL